MPIPLHDHLVRLAAIAVAVLLLGVAGCTSKSEPATPTPSADTAPPVAASADRQEVAIALTLAENGDITVNGQELGSTPLVEVLRKYAKPGASVSYTVRYVGNVMPRAPDEFYRRVSDANHEAGLSFKSYSTEE